MFDKKTLFIMSLDPECLKAFVAVSELGGFTRAAEALNRTQAAVSQQIKKLEDVLDAKLFERHSRAVALTAHGQLLLGYAKRLLLLQEEALNAFRNDEVKKTIRIGMPDDYAVSFMPLVINSFAQSHPMAEIELQCALSVELVEQVKKREIDLALITSQSGNVMGEQVRREQLVWVGAPGGMAHAREVIPLALFHTSDDKCMFSHGAVTLLNASGREHHVAYSSRSTSVLLSAVRADLAISVVAASSVTPDLTILGEREGLPALPTIGIDLVKRTDKHDPIIDEFGNHIMNALSV